MAIPKPNIAMNQSVKSHVSQGASGVSGPTGISGPTGQHGTTDRIEWDYLGWKELGPNYKQKDWNGTLSTLINYISNKYSQTANNKQPDRILVGPILADLVESLAFYNEEVQTLYGKKIEVVYGNISPDVIIITNSTCRNITWIIHVKNYSPTDLRRLVKLENNVTVIKANYNNFDNHPVVTKIDSMKHIHNIVELNTTPELKIKKNLLQKIFKL